jgi:hypothetical protein
MQPFLLLLQYIAAEQDTPYSGDELLFKLLHAQAFNIPPFEIARLSLEVHERHFTKNKTFLRALLQEKINLPPKDLFTPSLHEGLRNASLLLEKSIAAAHTLALPDWLSYIKKEGIATSLQPAAPGDIPANAVIQAHIEEETGRNPALTLKELVSTLPAAFEQLYPADSMPGAPEVEKPEPALVNALLSRFTMNVSALNSYLHCPLEFYYKNILRIPSAQNEAAGFGSAVHYALEQLFRKMLDAAGSSRQRQFPPPEVFIGDFETYMHAHREDFTAAQYNRRLHHGREVLSNYYASYIGSFPTVVAIERMIRVVYNGVPLKGKLDKLEFDGKLVTIVDYKTGDYDRAMARMQPPREEAPNGGDYWRQAVFYKILVDSYEEKGWKAVSTSFDFIEPDKTGRYRRENLLIGPADIATVGQQITRVWHEIRQQAFYTGCGAPTCSWCNFVKATRRQDTASFKV